MCVNICVCGGSGYGGVGTSTKVAYGLQFGSGYICSHKHTHKVTLADTQRAHLPSSYVVGHIHAAVYTPLKHLHELTYTCRQGLTVCI